MKHSEIFNADVARRRRVIKATLEERTLAAAEIGLTALADWIDRDGMAMPPRDLAALAKVTIKAAGLPGGRTTTVRQCIRSYDAQVRPGDRPQAARRRRVAGTGCGSPRPAAWRPPGSQVPPLWGPA